MCEAHRNLRGVAVAERTPSKAVTERTKPDMPGVSEEDTFRAAQDAMANFIQTFGRVNARKVLDLLDPINPKKKP